MTAVLCHATDTDFTYAVIGELGLSGRVLERIIKGDAVGGRHITLDQPPMNMMPPLMRYIGHERNCPQVELSPPRSATPFSSRRNQLPPLLFSLSSPGMD